MRAQKRIRILFFSFLLLFLFNTYLFSQTALKGNEVVQEKKIEQKKKNARGGQMLLPPDHWVNDALQALALEQGITLMNEQLPLTIMQIKAMLTQIEYNALSDYGKNQYDLIFDFFAENGFSLNASIVSFGLEPSANPEAFVKTSSDIPWFHDRYERKNILDLPVQVSVGDYAYLLMDLDIGMSKTAMQRNDVYVNVPYNGTTFDIHFPHNAYMSLGTKFTDTVGINFRLGDMPQANGRTTLGSILMSEYLTGATSAQIMIYSPIITFSSSITELNTNRYFYMHKLDVRPFKKLSITVMEGCLPYGNMDLRFFNPFTIFHGYAAWKDYKKNDSDVASFCGAKINFTPCKFLRLYGLFAMNQFQTSFELSDDETNPANFVPNGMAFQLGAESYVPIKQGALHFNLESYYALPYFCINENPNWSYVRTYQENFNETDTFYEWVGSKYGPDTLGLRFDAEYEVPQKWSAGLSYLFLARGELSSPNIFNKVGWGGNSFSFEESSKSSWVYPQSVNGAMVNKDGRKKVSPSGTPEYVNQVALKGTYSPAAWCTIKACPVFTFVFNSNHKEGAFACGFEFSLGAEFKFSKIGK